MIWREWHGGQQRFELSEEGRAQVRVVGQRGDGEGGAACLVKGDQVGGGEPGAGGREPHVAGAQELACAAARRGRKLRAQEATIEERGDAVRTRSGLCVEQCDVEAGARGWD